MIGRVKNVVADRGFCFIQVVISPGNPNAKNPRERRAHTLDYFGHRSSMRDGLRVEDLVEGDLLTFTPDPNSPKGPRAEDIRRVVEDDSALDIA